MQKYKYIDKNKQDALNLALYELNVKEEDILIFEKETKTGLFKTKKYELEIIKKEDIINFVKENAEKILNDIDIKVENFKVFDKKDHIVINLETNDDSRVIGKNGRNLKAINTILARALELELGHDFKISIDVSSYKNQKERRLYRNVKRIAKNVLKTGVEAELDPMNSYQRRLVHNYLNDFKGITTESRGEEPERYVVISKK